MWHPGTATWMKKMEQAISWIRVRQECVIVRALIPSIECKSKETFQFDCSAIFRLLLFSNSNLNVKKGFSSAISVELWKQRYT